MSDTLTGLVETVESKLVSSGVRDVMPENVVKTILEGMTIAETMRVSGADKRFIVTSVLDHLIDESRIDSNIKNTLKIAVPTVIDTVVDVTKNKYPINKRGTCCVIS